jgi:hypothetical protein
MAKKITILPPEQVKRPVQDHEINQNTFPVTAFDCYVRVQNKEKRRPHD